MHILVTGASKGIGRAIADHFLELGHNVFGVSRAELNTQHANYVHYCADVTDHENTAKILADIRKRKGSLDVLINNAGIARMNALALTPIENVQDIINTNFIGTFSYTQKAINLLRKSPNPRIVNMTTVAVPMNLAGESVYAASKSAVETLTRISAKELGVFGITCNAIGPSPIDTQLISGVGKEKIEKLIQNQAIKKMAGIEDVINALEFFIKPSSGMITGQVLYLGGIS